MTTEKISKEKYDTDMKLFTEVIEHWTRLATGEGYPEESIGSKDCAFCKVYIYEDSICRTTCPFILINKQR